MKLQHCTLIGRQPPIRWLCTTERLWCHFFQGEGRKLPIMLHTVPYRNTTHTMNSPSLKIAGNFKQVAKHYAQSPLRTAGLNSSRRTNSKATQKTLDKNFLIEVYSIAVLESNRSASEEVTSSTVSLPRCIRVIRQNSFLWLGWMGVKPQPSHSGITV